MGNACVNIGMHAVSTEFTTRFVILLGMKMSDSLATLPRTAPALELEIEHEQWLAAIAKGDESALGSFYDATVSRVFGLALRIVRQWEAAEALEKMRGQFGVT